MFFPLRNFVRSRGEEIFLGVVSIILPFVATCVLVWMVPFFGQHPFGFPDTAQLRLADYRTVFAGIYSSASFRSSGGFFWDALSRTANRQGRFLVWYYLWVVIEGLLVGLATTSYPWLERVPGYKFIANRIFLPSISVWHVLLTPFVYKQRASVAVRADILCTENLLYQGVVGDHFLDKDGNLMGIVLTDARRFRRDDYLKDKRDLGAKIDPQNYWRSIPGAKLFIVGDKILNLNLSYDFAAPALEEMLRKLILEGLKQKVTVTLGEEKKQ